MVLTLWSLLASLFGLGLALGVVIAVGLLLFFQVRSVMKNQTGIEDWIREKADYRYKVYRTLLQTELKCILSKIKEVRQTVHMALQPRQTGEPQTGLNSAHSCGARLPAAGYRLELPAGRGRGGVAGGGRDRPVHSHQVARAGVPGTAVLSRREQLRQKEDKRERTREYEIGGKHCKLPSLYCAAVSAYSGSWLPVSQGLSVCCHPPCTDEPRVPVQPGQAVRVTR